MSIDKLIDKISKGISENELERSLAELNQKLASSRYHHEIIIQSGKLKNLNRQQRLGLLSLEEADRIRTRISLQILEMLEEARGDKEANKIIRHNDKWAEFDSRLDVTVRIIDDSGVPIIRYYKTTVFADANDFLNEVYLEISGKVRPGTYGRDWVLLDEASGEELSVETISNRIDQEHPMLETFFFEMENLDFIVKFKG